MNTTFSTDNRQGSPLVSFIITYHNEPADMLHACIESILALSLGDSEREIIIIDDGSDVSPVSFLTDCIDEVVYVRQRNMGLSQARNRGIDMAHGYFIQFVDADDAIIAPPYEQCLDLVRYQQADLVMFCCSDTSETSFTPVSVSPVSGSHFMRESNIRAAACGYLFARRILGSLRFEPNIYHEDEAFTPQLLLRAERVFNTPYKAYYYRARHDSITRSSDQDTISKRLDDTLTVLTQLYRLTDKLSPADRPAMERRIAQLTMDYLYNTIMLTRSAKKLDATIDALRQQGLFPLPDRSYSKKYTWFRRLVGNAIGRRALLASLPLLPRH